MTYLSLTRQFIAPHRPIAIDLVGVEGILAWMGRPTGRLGSNKYGEFVCPWCQKNFSNQASHVLIKHVIHHLRRLPDHGEIQCDRCDPPFVGVNARVEEHKEYCKGCPTGSNIPAPELLYSVEDVVAQSSTSWIVRGKDTLYMPKPALHSVATHVQSLLGMIDISVPLLVCSRRSKVSPLGWEIYRNRPEYEKSCRTLALS